MQSGQASPPPPRRRRRAVAILLAATLAAGPLAGSAAFAQLAGPVAPGAAAGGGLAATVPASNAYPGPMEDLAGRTVEAVRVAGNSAVPASTILNTARTRVGTPFDPKTVREDYQRLFGLRKFSNVEARVERTATGVVVVFDVTEQKQVSRISFVGNAHVNDRALRAVVNIAPGEAIDPFRIGLARRAIETLYTGKNYAFARVSVDDQQLKQTGDLIFNVVEGPQVFVRDVNFIGNKQIGSFRLGQKIQTRPYFPIFISGLYDPERVDDDVASIRTYYLQKGFFDVRVGRKVRFGPENKEVAVDFVIDEGPRYTVQSVTFAGNKSFTTEQLKGGLKLVEGIPYDSDLLQRDVRRLVKDYGPTGQIYEPQSQDPEYLQIEARPVFGREPGALELRYDIREGSPFRIGNILVRGNSRTQEKVVLREMRIAPGEKYDSSRVEEAKRRLAGTPYFSAVKITPVGNDPEKRDILVEVVEAKTAILTLGAGINSNGGVGGNITYVQRNFDATNLPGSFGDIFSDRAFVGAGQLLRLSLEPGTQATNASVYFREPYLFDQAYSLSLEAYYRDRSRLVYDERRSGGRVAVGRRFGLEYAAEVGLRVEDVYINNIQDKPIRAFEILDNNGDNLITSVSLSGRRDTTDRPVLPSQGSITTAGVEFFGALGGDATYQQITLGHDQYFTLSEDLLDRRVILAVHADAAYIFGDAPFFNRLYGGGIGSIRGFSFRGVTPRSGPDDDRVGGNFSATGSVELSFPLYGDTLRGVVFSDVGTVEPSFELGTIRSSIGAGFRVTLGFLGQIPIAVDFAIPITQDSKDDTQIISFSLGILP